ncbi:MAG TPA: hypothetical protein VGG64_04495 [Pirellulales bacterium]
MNIRMARHCRTLTGGAMLAAILLGSQSVSAADTLTIDSNLSMLNFQFSLVGLDDGTVLGTFVGQGDVPQGTLSSGNGMRFPGFSNGLSAQATGTIDITPGAFSIDGGSNVGLLDSGLWQPGSPSGSSFTAAPIAGQLGGYLVTTLGAGPAPDTFIPARINNALFNFVSSDALPLGPGGAFSDPLGVAGLTAGDIALSAINPLSGLYNASSFIPPTNGSVDLSGTYLNGQLSMAVAGSLTVDATDLFLGLPIGIQISLTGNIVTTPVPEPASETLFISGIAFGVFLVTQARKRTSSVLLANSAAMWRPWQANHKAPATLVANATLYHSRRA